MVTPDSPLYERDPKAWREYLAEGNAKQARKRVSADVIIRDAAGKILLVNPSYKPDWDVPGGMVEANEPPHVAARRELKEELGVDLRVGPLLVVDWVSPHDPWDDLLSMVFDSASLTSEQISKIQFRDKEISDYQFCDRTQAAERLRPYVWRRVAAALDAQESKSALYLVDGHQAGFR
ncbi:NUDIX domain-containing protein [Winogradskya humida]|uniref:NUDIX hydrolase n=1 Tax=Winogradskya humida TaxID=113566 RepID=A0ABQ4A239_9ACTN|nr:NUDIX hydrolase [Actinoplanes humidus]GIE24774.1 NUDIX hydrolase [Actinoplanes humidus]